MSLPLISIHVSDVVALCKYGMYRYPLKEKTNKKYCVSVVKVLSCSMTNRQAHTAVSTGITCIHVCWQTRPFWNTHTSTCWSKSESLRVPPQPSWVFLPASCPWAAGLITDAELWEWRQFTLRRIQWPWVCDTDMLHRVTGSVPVCTLLHNVLSTSFYFRLLHLDHNMD